MDKQALYLQDPQKLEFKSNVVQILNLQDGNLGVILDQTYFYPTGGGQNHDTGSLGKAKVIDVIKDEERHAVIHVLDREIPQGPVKASIDRERRFRHMQHHTAQHLLTQCIERLFDLETVSAHINGYSTSTIDIPPCQLTREDLNKADVLANQIIYENRRVKSYFVSPDELDHIPLRKQPQVSEEIRIVEIESFDYSACGATHCLNTGTIGMIKILKTENQNQKTRLHFIAGIRALEEFQNIHEITSTLANHFSTHSQELVGTITQQSMQLRKAEKEIESLRNKQLQYEILELIQSCERVGDICILFSNYENRPIKEIRMMANEAKNHHNLIAVFTSHEGDKVGVVVTCGMETNINASELIRTILGSIDGRGGGDQQIAQGGGTINQEQFQSFNEEIKVVVDQVVGI